MKKRLFLLLTTLLGGKHAPGRSVQCLFLIIFILMPMAVSAQSEPPGDIMSRPTFGVHKVLFIRVIYPDDNRVVLSGQRAPIHANNLNDIFKANSYEKLALDIDVTPVLMMPQPTSFYQLENRLSFVRLRADAIKIAEDAGFLESDYDREIIFTVKIWPQPFTGIGGVNLRTSFMTRDNPTLSAHEVGHTFDFNHANFWRVTSANPIDTVGTLIEYGDKFDVMGDVHHFHHYNPRNKFRLGWIPPESILTVSESGTYTIRAVEKPPLAGVTVNEYTALRIRRTPISDYWVFYRSQEDSANTGAMITRIESRNSSSSILLDMAPGSLPEKRDYQDAALVPGKTVRDQEAGIEIEVLERHSDSLIVRVVVPQAGLDTLPVIDIVSPAFGKTIKGGVDYEATAFDPDVGQVNGAGIDTVKFILGYPEGDDPYGEGLSFVILAVKDFSAPPYIFHVETASFPDESYRLIVGALSQNGGINRAIINHLIDNTGPSAETAVAAKPVELVNTLQLQQNYPNPFNPSTTINYSVARAGKVELTIYDLLGKKVRTLVAANNSAGEYAVLWDGRNDADRRVGSGSYYYKLRVGEHTSTKRMLLLK